MTLVYLKIPREIPRHVPNCASAADVVVVNEKMALLRTGNVLLFEIEFQCNPK